MTISTGLCNLHIKKINVYSLYLSCEGNSIEIKNVKEEDPIYKKKRQAESCKTNKQVLAFLETLKSTEMRFHFNFFIVQKAFPDDTQIWSEVAFPSDLDEQIAIVQQEIDKKIYRIKHPSKSCCVIQ